MYVQIQVSRLAVPIIIELKSLLEVRYENNGGKVLNDFHYSVAIFAASRLQK